MSKKNLHWGRFYHHHWLDLRQYEAVGDTSTPPWYLDCSSSFCCAIDPVCLLGGEQCGRLTCILCGRVLWRWIWRQGILICRLCGTWFYRLLSYQNGTIALLFYKKKKIEISARECFFLHLILGSAGILEHRIKDFYFKFTWRGERKKEIQFRRDARLIYCFYPWNV